MASPDLVALQNAIAPEAVEAVEMTAEAILVNLNLSGWFLVQKVNEYDGPQFTKEELGKIKELCKDNLVDVGDDYADMVRKYDFEGLEKWAAHHKVVVQVQEKLSPKCSAKDCGDIVYEQGMCFRHYEKAKIEQIDRLDA